MKSKDVYSPYKFVHLLPELKRIKNKEIVEPINLQIDLTNYCNNDCRWCYYTIHDHIDEFSKTDKLDKDLAMRILEEFKELGGQSIEITGGGEPLLSPYFKEFSQKARELGLDRALVTNGVLMTDDIIDEIKDYSWVRVSLNSASSEIYEQIHNRPGKNYHKVVSNLEKLCMAKEDDCIVGISMITDEINYKDIYGMAKVGKYVKADNVRISLAHTPEKAALFDGIWDDVLEQIEQAQELGDEDFKVFAFSNRLKDINRESRGGFCYYHHFTTAVGANGAVYPCCYFKDISTYNLGDLNKQSFKDIWYGNKRQNFIDKIGNDCPASCWMTDKNKLGDYLTMDKKDVPHLKFP